MTVAYVRSIPYLSPSALFMLEQNPVEFYLRRLGPSEHAPPREAQGFAAAVGIAFDALVKVEVARERALKRCPSEEFLLNEVQIERDRAIAVARVCLDGYKKSGAFLRLMEDGPTDVAVDGEDFAPGTRVPVRTRIDAITSYAKRTTIHDWKVKGANKPGSASPTPGYNVLWDTDSPGMPLRCHHRCGEPMEQIDEEWATQLAIYGWAVGMPISPDAYGSIDQVIVGADGRIRVAQFRAKIGEAFQRSVIERLKEAWRKIEAREVVPAHMTLEQLKVML